MKKLTEIEQKSKSGLKLSQDELIFLYEIDSSIEGFGYGDDPRVKELRFQRKPEEDMLIIFGSEPDQIAGSAGGITANTRAYVGPLEKGIFDKFEQFGIEHIYTSFPEGKIRRETVEIGGTDFKQIAQELEDKLNIIDTLTWEKTGEILKQVEGGSVQISAETTQFLRQLFERQINVSGYALDMLKNSEFTTSPTPINIDTVRLKISALDLKGTPTTDQVYARANELGLDLCPAEVGPHKRFKDTNEPMGDWEYIAMKQMTDRGGHLDVFVLGRDGRGLWLAGRWADPDHGWPPEDEIVFRLRKSETQPLKPSGFFSRFLSR
ncbi:MAG: hypothetical protein G01um10147_542 [Microgenomates group bacterium Gr01-1014_7]|nr:MAG: hypothetical protein G01um10147_542 [Microgenomates group bacterium Gr01-1014_7]